MGRASGSRATRHDWLAILGSIRCHFAARGSARDWPPRGAASARFAAGHRVPRRTRFAMWSTGEVSINVRPRYAAAPDDGSATEAPLDSSLEALSTAPALTARSPPRCRRA
ncbi:hypothetical protein PHYPSEUDO_008985 [Phytophthora pseudosyringae]|uniref:Uncharacterized protein n=1 Tax=Phytophthora pseudosyringae TaxID=221518 RepID=A0A8T1WDB5_9STRA|nr:hypothetical protein PHYPSEUDO_008985 [Phytophthora pseudosyringae]